ncbi:MAG TPA: hypothetical protein VI356_24720 [Myxococcales bacterium]
MHRPVIAALMAAAFASGAADAVEEAERRIAQCVDQYNTQDAFRDEQVPENPGLVLYLRPVGGYGSADAFHAAANAWGFGSIVDADTLLTLFRSGHTRTGLAVGVSAIVYSVPDRSLSYGGELRLGLGRRRYGVPVFEPAFLRALQPSSCRFERMDLRIDFVRFRLQGLKDLAAGDTERISSVQLLVVTQAHVFGGWNWTWSLSLADFQLAPSFDWGPSLYADLQLFGPLVFSATVGLRVPRFHGFALFGLGLRFQLFEGASLSG